LFTSGIFFEIFESGQILDYFFHSNSNGVILKFWAIFISNSSGHPDFLILSKATTFQEKNSQK
jgi:hypothetical protein